jgi:hypothetical protein
VGKEEKEEAFAKTGLTDIIDHRFKLQASRFKAAPSDALQHHLQYDRTNPKANEQHVRREIGHPRRRDVDPRATKNAILVKVVYQATTVLRRVGRMHLDPDLALALIGARLRLANCGQGWG